MRFLLLNQTFYPDPVATAEHLAQLAVALVARGHQVTVVASRRAYNEPEKLFPKKETWRGIRIIRIGSTGFGKSAKWRRAADFASFLTHCTLRLAMLPRHDAIVALTSPPLISFLGAWVAKLRRCHFYYWVMDFNPDEAIAAGWLRGDSFAAKVLDRMSRFSLRHARKVIALDRFMRDRIEAKGIAAGRVAVVPPWSHDTHVNFDPVGRERFRKANGLEGKFVVMHSGNHSPCHPLDTLLGAVQRLASDPEILFCFIGGGSEFKRVQEWAARRGCNNLLCLPYRPLDELSASLSAADLHVVLMGGAFVGLVHPCKIYNILAVGAPVLYIGPSPSHVSDIANSANGEVLCLSSRHDDADTLFKNIQRARAATGQFSRQTSPIVRARFSKAAVLSKLIAELESA